jgi:hypothetical protein
MKISGHCRRTSKRENQLLEGYCSLYISRAAIRCCVSVRVSANLGSAVEEWAKVGQIQ